MSSVAQIIKTAVISACGLYRYTLSRSWDGSLPLLIFIMLNPSTADADFDDPTVKRCMAFARAMGFGGIWVINLFAFRATEPKDMKAAADPVGPANDDWIAKIVANNPEADGARFVCAWGNNGRLFDRDIKVVEFLEGLGVTLYCLRKGKDGDPSHPLYLPGDLTLIPLRTADAALEAA